MAQTQALSIYINEDTKADLRNQIAGVFENLAKKTISGRLKSKNGILNERAGSFEFKRFANATAATYGTARKDGNGAKIKAVPVIVNMSRNKEIVEEVNTFDAGSFTEEDLNSFLARRKVAIQQAVERDLDREFFAAIAGNYVASGSSDNVTAGGTQGATIDTTKEIVPQLEAIITSLETTKNDYVDGVDREQMALVLTPELYGKVKTELNDCYNFSGTVADEIFKGINGVACFSSNRLPSYKNASSKQTDVQYTLVVMDAVAQPVMLTDTEIEKIPLSNEHAVEVFYRFGTKVLASELAIYGQKVAT